MLLRLGDGIGDGPAGWLRRAEDRCRIVYRSRSTQAERRERTGSAEAARRAGSAEAASASRIVMATPVE
jgi:hypothetical protein